MQGQQPQYSQAYDPRPPQGYNQGPAYQQGLSQPAYGQPAYGQPMYVPVGAPPQQSSTTRTIVIVVVVVVVLIIIIPMALSLYMFSMVSSMPQSGGTVETQLGIRIEQASPGGNWTVSVTAGSSKVSDILVQVVDANTGVKTVNSPLSSGETADFKFNNNDASTEGSLPRIDAGDSIILNAASSHIKAGYRFQLLHGESIVAGPRELP